MARPTIVYASGGSNTQASGAGPATAVFGTNATVVGQVITLDGTPDLSGVATDGSHVIWFESTDSASNIRLFRITAVDDGADTVTVTGTIVGTGVNWAIGGKRVDPFNSLRLDHLDQEAGWTFEFGTGTYVFAIGWGMDQGDKTDGPVTVVATSGESPIFDVTTNVRHILVNTGTDCVVDGIKFTRSSGTWVGGNAILTNSAFDHLTVKNVVVDGTGMEDGFNIAHNGPVDIYDTDIFDCGGNGMSIGGNRPEVTLVNVRCHDNDDSGIDLQSVDTFCSFRAVRCKFYHNGDHGLDLADALDGGQNSHLILQCTFERNTNAGLDANSTAGAATSLALVGNEFSENGTYGVDASATVAFAVTMNLANNYFSNTSGARNNLAAGLGDTAVDPDYESVTDGAEDYRLKSTSDLIGAGHPIAVK